MYILDFDIFIIWCNLALTVNLISRKILFLNFYIKKEHNVYRHKTKTAVFIAGA